MSAELLIGIIGTLIVIVPVFIFAENQRERVFTSQRDKLKNHNFSLFTENSRLKDEAEVLRRDLNLARQAAETIQVGELMPAKTVKLGYTQGLYSDFPSEMEMVQETIKAGLADSISPFIKWTQHGGSVRGTLLVVAPLDE